ncbi:hypothetical protein Bca4012_045139 [Brassica carinata]
MITSSEEGSNKILVAISLDRDESQNALSWAINVLAKPNDTIVALHLLVGEEPKKIPMKKKKRIQIRRAKAHVISMLGEFAYTCCQNQVNLEAKVGFCSKIGRGLINEVKSISAHYLVLSRPTSHAFRIWNEITRYVSDFAPSSCSIVFVGNPRKQHKDCYSDSDISRDIKSEKYSPRSVLSILSRDLISSSGDDASSFISSMVSSSVASPSDKPKHRPMSPYRLISSLIMNSPLRKWRRNETKNNPKPLIQCFTYNEISKATKDFDQENIVGIGGYSEVYRGDLCDGRRIAAKPALETGNTRELVDPKLQEKYDDQQMNRLVLTASHCVQQSPILRPTMTQVLELLTNGNEAEVAKSWRMPKDMTNGDENNNEWDDYSMLLGYDVPLDSSI